MLHRNTLCGVLASAACCLPLAAHAADAVTLYGVVDVGYQYDKTEGQAARSGLGSGQAGQSRFGLRGSEDLGNGMKATFQLEGGFLTTTGNSTQGRLFGRQATLGLAGRFGEIRLGRQTVFGYAWTPAIASPFGLSWLRSSVGTTFGYKQGDFGDDGRISNSVLYFSPKWHGLEFGVGYAFATDQQVQGTGNNDRVVTGGVRYTQGPLRLGATYEWLNPSKAEPVQRRNAKNLQVAGSYDFGVVRLHAGYNEQRDINVSPATGFVETGGERDRVYTLGVSAPIGPGRVLASYQNATKSKVDGFGLAYQYDLSKRTFLYAMYNDFDTRDHYTGEDVGRRQVALGLQHKF
ncbi:porin [Verticiella sediminum]|nr:porin [Verticiella sediminum]